MIYLLVQGYLLEPFDLGALLSERISYSFINWFRLVHCTQTINSKWLRFEARIGKLCAVLSHPLSARTDLKSLAVVTHSSAMINSSFRQGIIPDQWKISRATRKCFPVKTVENDIRPKAITNPIAKIAESLLRRFFKEHVAPFLDTNRYGYAVRRSILIKITVELIHILFLDFSKGFAFIFV